MKPTQELFNAIDTRIAAGELPVVVSLGGPSASGKSAILTQFEEHYPGYAVLETDDYYIGKTRMQRELPPDIAHDFDNPASVDLSLLKSHIDLLKQGKTFQHPRYDMLTSEPTGDTVEVTGKGLKLLIVEGIMANLPNLAESIDIHAVVTASPETRLARRIKRDIVRKGLTPEQITAYFTEEVEPNYQKYYQPHDKQAEFVINTDTP